jgi:hypothetical protein
LVVCQPVITVLVQNVRSQMMTNEIKPTGDGLANRESGRPDYADIPPIALQYWATGYTYWEAEPEAALPELCHVLDRVFEAIDSTAGFEQFAELLGQAMAGLSIHMLGERASRHSGRRTYDSIQRGAVDRLGETFAEDAKKYGAFNWRKGLPLRNLLSHAIGHIYLLADGNTSENHLGHFLWNCAVAIYMAKHRPELDDRYRSPLKNFCNIKSAVATLDPGKISAAFEAAQLGGVICQSDSGIKGSL